MVGADPASGKSKKHDWAAAVVVDVATGEDVATWRGHVEPRELAEVASLLGEYYAGSTGQALVVPEANNHGIAFLDELRRLGYQSIYSRRVWDRVENDYISQLGFTTSMRTRPILINRGRAALADGEVRINNPVILQEMMTFVRDDNGKEDHQPGCNDDTLFAWCLAQEGRAVTYSSALVQQEDELPAPGSRESRIAEQRWVWESAEKKIEGSRVVHDDEYLFSDI